MNESELNADDLLSGITSTHINASTATASATASSSARIFIHHPPRIDPDQYQADVPDWNPPQHLSNGKYDGFIRLMMILPLDYSHLTTANDYSYLTTPT